MSTGVSASVHAGIHLPRQVHTPQATPPLREGTPPLHDGHCSGRDASYWNAFLLFILDLTLDIC